MIVYKLCRLLKSGEITSLFINKSKKLPFNKWIKSESYKTKGYKLRPYWHCVLEPKAPHLSKLNRVWVKVEIRDYTSIRRPESQGGIWYLANMIRFLQIL